MKSPVLLARDYFVRCCCFCCCCFFSNVGVPRCLLMDSSALQYANIPKHIFSFEFSDDVTMCCLYTIALYIDWASIVSLLIPSLTAKKRGRRAWCGRGTPRAWRGSLGKGDENWLLKYHLSNLIGYYADKSEWIWKTADRWVLSFEQMDLLWFIMIYPPGN